MFAVSNTPDTLDGVVTAGSTGFVAAPCESSWYTSRNSSAAPRCGSRPSWARPRLPPRPRKGRNTLSHTAPRPCRTPKLSWMHAAWP